ncbi:MAG TPA: hypothetical protein VFF44_12545 [Casimicrobiaceae bacterium]|nr:hypothetical protein [Casimicrobiaceae bacterium]
MSPIIPFIFQSSHAILERVEKPSPEKEKGVPLEEPQPDLRIDPIPALWAELGEHLRERFRQLSLEIRHYPTPIARCDDQLPKLIEQRDHARAELARVRATEALCSGSDAPSLRAVERFVADAPPTDDETELAIRSRLGAAARAGR